MDFVRQITDENVRHAYVMQVTHLMRNPRATPGSSTAPPATEPHIDQRYVAWQPLHLGIGPRVRPMERQTAPRSSRRRCSVSSWPADSSTCRAWSQPPLGPNWPTYGVRPSLPPPDFGQLHGGRRSEVACSAASAGALRASAALVRGRSLPRFGQVWTAGPRRPIFGSRPKRRIRAPRGV